MGPIASSYTQLGEQRKRLGRAPGTRAPEGRVTQRPSQTGSHSPASGDGLERDAHVRCCGLDTAMKFRDLWRLIKQTISEWLDDKAPTYAAALAYYTIFSIAPLLIIAVAVAGFVFGGDAVRGDIHRELEGLIGEIGRASCRERV